jgi:hypothetical protein
VGSVLHLSDDERYRSLNDCVCVGEVRARDKGASLLVRDVAELVREPVAE